MAGKTRAFAPVQPPAQPAAGDEGCPSGPPRQGPTFPFEHLLAGIRDAWYAQKHLSIPNTVLKLVTGACPCCYIINPNYKMKKEERE